MSSTKYRSDREVAGLMQNLPRIPGEGKNKVSKSLLRKHYFHPHETVYYLWLLTVDASREFLFSIFRFRHLTK